MTTFVGNVFQFSPERFLQPGVLAGIATIIFGLTIFLAGNAIVSKVAEKKIKGKLTPSQGRNIMLSTKIFGFLVVLTGVLVAVLVVK